MHRPPPTWNQFLGLAAITFLSSSVASAQLLVASQLGQEILAYDADDGSFEGVFARTVTKGFRTPGGLAMRSSDGQLFVSSVATGEIWSYSTTTGLPGATAVTTDLTSPFGVDIDDSGTHLYVADASGPESEFNDAVLQVDVATGVVTTIGTNSQADLVAIAVQGSDVYATDVELDRILRFPIGGGPTSVEISSGLSGPTGLLVLGPDLMLVADTDNDRVLEFTKAGGDWTLSREVLPPSGGVLAPSGLAMSPDGRLTVTGRDSGNTVLIDLSTLVTSQLVAPGAGGHSDPVDVTWYGQELQIASRGGNAVFYFDALGQPTGVRAEGLSASLDAGIHLSSDGSRLFAASIGANDVVEFDVASGARIRTFNQACPNLPLPFDSVLGSDLNLYVSCTLNSSIEYFDGVLGTSLGSFVLAGSGGLFSPRGLAFGPNGNLFVANGSGAVLEFNGTTGAPVIPGPFIDTNANGGGPLDAFGLTLHGGVLYVTSFLHDEVMAFNAITGGYQSTFVTAGSGGLIAPTASAVGPAGDLYVVSQGDNAIRRYKGSTGAFVETFVMPGSGGLDSPFDLVFLTSAPPSVPALSPGANVALALLIGLGILWWVRLQSSSPKIT